MAQERRDHPDQGLVEPDNQERQRRRGKRTDPRRRCLRSAGSDSTYRPVKSPITFDLPDRLTRAGAAPWARPPSMSCTLAGSPVLPSDGLARLRVLRRRCSSDAASFLPRPGPPAVRSGGLHPPNGRRGSLVHRIDNVAVAAEGVRSLVAGALIRMMPWPPMVPSCRCGPLAPEMRAGRLG